MIDLAQNGYTHEQVLRLLHFPNGSRKERYRIDVLRGNTVVGQAEYTSCSITCDKDSQVKYSASITVREADWIDWHGDFLQPVMELEAMGQRFVFPFVPMKPMSVKCTVRGGMALRQVEAYDETVALQDNSIGRRLFIPKGSVYTAVLDGLLREVGFSRVQIDASSATVADDREDWEKDDSIFDIVNQLLGEIGYTSLTVDRDGVLVARKDLGYTGETVGISYREAGNSILLAERETELDAFGRPNVFIGEVNNPALEEPLSYTYINEDPQSPVSTIRTRKRNTAVRRWDNVASQEILADNVRRWAREETEAYEVSTLQTSIMPHHGVGELVTVEAGELQGVYQETGWSIDELRPGGTMSHSIRSVLYG